MCVDKTINKKKIKKAFILAAGFGKRMMPLTKNCPKPLLKLNNKPIIDHIIDKLEAYGIEEIIINTHYLPEQFEQHFANCSKVTLIKEKDILETAGGLKNAYNLDLLGDEPLFIITGDIFWQETSDTTALQQVSDSWFANTNPNKAGLLLLEPTKNAFGYNGNGDFNILENNLLQHKGEPQNIAPYIFAGIQIIDPKLFKNDNLEKFGHKFALVEIYKLYTNSFYGIINKADWFHLGDKESLEKTSSLLLNKT